jgi:hypothetical protein
MIVEIFTTTDRLPYLQKNMNDKIVVMSHPDGTGQVKVQVVVDDAMDVMNIFHAGVSYGLDKMQAVYTNK